MVGACPGCYKPQKRLSYCSECRRKLFDGIKVPPVLGFNPPVGEDAYWFERQLLRLAVPGSQPKYSLMLEDDELVLTREDVKGLFLLKLPPVSGDYQHVRMFTQNEHLTLQIAANVFDIKTVENGLVYFKDESPALLLRRFDVDPDHVSFQQEDFMQLKDRQPAAAQNTYEYMGALIKKHIAAYGPAMIIFFKRIVFNYLFSVRDAGLRGFSIQRTEHGDYALAPAYGLRCTPLHEKGSSDTGLELYTGVNKSPHYEQQKYYGLPEFIGLARRLGINEARAVSIIDNMTGKEHAVRNMVEQSFLSGSLRKEYLRLFLEKQVRIKSTYP
jgi:serine/threonine-protein kinase HipA